MDYILSFILLFGLPICALGCKSKAIASEPSCPKGYWEVPDGWKSYKRTYNCGENCNNNEKCLNYRYLCDETTDSRRDGTNMTIDYSNGSIDESICSDEFCSSLPDGRTKHCPGTTRCIKPTVTYFEGTNIPIGPICAEVKNL